MFKLNFDFFFVLCLAVKLLLCLVVSVVTLLFVLFCLPWLFLVFGFCFIKARFLFHFIFDSVCNCIWVQLPLP